MTETPLETLIAERRMQLHNCPMGLFLFDDGDGDPCLGMMTEYRTESKSSPGFWQRDAYVVASGEYFWGGTSDAQKRAKLLVYPIDDAELSRMLASALRARAALPREGA